jgi:Mg-chelatase subunit ChlD
MRAAAVVLLLCAVAAADWSETQRRFRSTYRADVGAEQRKEALLELARADLPEAAALLLDTWEDLDKDAVRRRRDLFRVREKMRALRFKAKETPGKRESILEDLARYEEEEREQDTRLAALEIEQSAILDGIALLKAPETIAWLAKAGIDRASSPAILSAVAARIATAKGAGVSTLLAALEGLSKPDHLIPLLQALGERSVFADAATWDIGLPVLRKHLEHRDWAVRVAAASAIARAARPDGVGPLVEALDREAEGSRARREIGRALERLTGRKYGEDADLWARWWREHEARVRSGEIELGKGEPAPDSGDVPRFYGIPQVAKRIIYVVDISGSMEVSLENPKFVDGAAVAAHDDEDSRFDAAVRELLRATRSLQRDASFAVVLYNSHVEPLHKALVPATKENTTKLERAIAHTGPSGSTNVYEALDQALRLANVHPESKGEQKADAIYLISDGSPTNFKGDPEDPERTRNALREWNAHRRVAIHTIGIGAEHNAGLLQVIAAENGGEYHAVLPKRK